MWQRAIVASGSGSGGYQFLKTEQLTVASKNTNITGLTIGKKYIVVLAFAWTNTNYNAEVSMGGVSGLTLVESAVERVASNVGAYLCQSVYEFTATNTTASISFGNAANNFSARAFVFESI